MDVLKDKLRRRSARRKKLPVAPSWATEGTRLTFRAELMPGRDAIERTFMVARALTNGRVELIGLGGEHAMTEFEPVH